MLRPRFSKRRFKSRSSIQCESLEERRLLTALVINDTSAADTITLSAANNGIIVVFNGAETDYKPNQFDSVNINNTLGGDTINVRATIVPTFVHYVANNVTINVGDASGVQNIKAALNMNGVGAGPVADGTAAIFINDTGDTAPRSISFTPNRQQQLITGLAPAEISIGVSIHPLAAGDGAAPGAPVGVESLGLTTGAGADTLTISSLRSNLGTSLYNAGGNDAINIGNGTLANIGSAIAVWGRSDQFAIGHSTLTLDDSTDVAPAQFHLTAIYPPGPGAIVYADFQGTAIPTQRVSFRVAEIATTSLNGGAGGNKFTIDALPARTSADGVLNINTGNGSDSVNINATAGGTLVNVYNSGGTDAYKAGPLGPFAPTGVNGNLEFNGSISKGTSGNSTLTILGPESNLLDIPTVPVDVSAGLLQHRDLTIQYVNIGTLQLEHGNYQINADLGPIALSIASEPSTISFESETAVTFNATQHLQSLNISAGEVTLARGAAIVLNTNGLALTGGTIDVTDNSIQVHYTGSTPFATIRNAIFAKQIKTSSADAHHALGYADSADNIVPNLPANTVLVTYALAGDANLGKSVGFADLVAVAQHYGQSTNGNWDQGDFNFDGAVGFADLVIVAQNYGQTLSPILSPALAVASLPVPAATPSTSAATPVKKPVSKTSSAVRR